ncbi:MAG: DUF4175 family protein [Alphaproteobacteria bacterium]|nr:DUF4175 family protein [Alphaproteobacteria bacterium]
MLTRQTSACSLKKTDPSGSLRLTSEKKKIPAFRSSLLVGVTVLALLGWSLGGGKLMATLNPIVRMQGKLFTPPLDAWITPPEYTGLPPMIIATPAGIRQDGAIIDVPEGSVVTSHLAERKSGNMDLAINGQTQPFLPDKHNGFGATETIQTGDMIALRQGGKDIHAWRIRVVPDQPPAVAFTAAPSITTRQAVRLAYEASDDYGVTSVIARISPRDSKPLAGHEPVDIPLASSNARELKRISFEDLTAHRWAGQPVRLQLVATDAKGHTTESDSIEFTLPERIFFHPVARALVEERKKLMANPGDEILRNEAANIMAGIAHQPLIYRGDPIVLMSLRSGAVRLVLDHDRATAAPVNDLIWQAAVRIEDGMSGIAENNLRTAQRELADALDRQASDDEVHALIDRLHQALMKYLSELSKPTASRPAPLNNTNQASRQQINKLVPQDLGRMLQQIRDLSSSGAADEAREEFLKLQQRLENLRAESSSLIEPHRQPATAIERLMQNF